MSEQKWRSVEAQLWKPEKEGECIEGIYLGWEEIRLRDSGVKRYLIGDGEVTKWAVLGTTVLNRLMDRVSTHSRVRITYLGDGRSNAGRKVKLYQVEVPVEAD